MENALRVFSNYKTPITNDEEEHADSREEDKKTVYHNDDEF